MSLYADNASRFATRPSPELVDMLLSQALDVALDYIRDGHPEPARIRLRTVLLKCERIDGRKAAGRIVEVVR